MPLRCTALTFVLLLAAFSCTGRAGSPGPGSASGGPPTSGSTPSSAGSGGRPIVLPVVATTSGPLAADDRSYLDGMRLAVETVNRAGGVRGRPLALELHDDGGQASGASAAILSVLARRPAAVLYAGPGPTLTPLRSRFAQTGTPVVLLGGDLYTSRALFPEVFQTAIPWEWQANVIARYVVVDRKARNIVFLGSGPEARSASRSLATALSYWGGRLAASVVDLRPDLPSAPPALRRAAAAGWDVVFGPPGDATALVRAVEARAGIDRSARPGQRPGISGPASLLVQEPGQARLEPGTTACYTYTWAGWAQPIRRVADFRLGLATMTGRAPEGLEQEGYDAVRVLAWALARTGGRGGPRLTVALEGAHDLAFSSFPIDLGPDDHLFLPRDELGLFAVAGPRERLDPWEIPGTEPWRPVMRTFTYDGERTNVLDMDRRVFFPWWTKYKPGPKYWTSRYGIASRPSDPLH